MADQPLSEKFAARAAYEVDAQQLAQYALRMLRMVEMVVTRWQAILPLGADAAMQMTKALEDRGSLHQADATDILDLAGGDPAREVLLHAAQAMENYYGASTQIWSSFPAFVFPADDPLIEMRDLLLAGFRGWSDQMSEFLDMMERISGSARDLAAENQPEGTISIGAFRKTKTVRDLCIEFGAHASHAGASCMEFLSMLALARNALLPYAEKDLAGIYERREALDREHAEPSPDAKTIPVRYEP